MVIPNASLLKLTNLLCLTHTARRTRPVPLFFPNYSTRSLCAAPRDELGITKWRRNFEAFRASALRTSLPVNLSSSPCGKAKQRNSCFQAFPLGSSRKTAQLLFSRKMGFPKDRLALAVPLLRTLFPLLPMSALRQLDPNDIRPILNKEYFYSPANKNS